MPDKEYTISEVVHKTGLKSHTIRYWEEELKLDIHRNNMGHRYYTDKDIALFLKIKDLKAKGFQLKAIKPMLIRNDEEDETSLEAVIAPDTKEDEIQELLDVYLEMVKVFEIPLDVVKESLLEVIEKARSNQIKNEIACTDLVKTQQREKVETENEQFWMDFNSKLDTIITLQKEVVE
ncbi:MAG: helix-turn-helix domain-containing protein, partial [bacterium]|nr:helix-turn-helix domain-containing protein [bacterium]